MTREEAQLKSLIRIISLFSILLGAWFVLFSMPNGGSAVQPMPGRVTARPIETAKSGDRVWACDPVTSVWSIREVVRPLVHDYVGDLISIQAAGERIEATGNHPFWVASGKNLQDRRAVHDVPDGEEITAAAGGSGRWCEARDLQLGDVLLLRSGQMATVEALHARQVEQKVYNLEVADLHTYAVGNAGVLVHNKAMQIAPIQRRDSSNYVYRAVRPEELDAIRRGDGILRGAGRTTATQHVLGVRHAQDPWVSTTRSLESARFFATKGGTQPTNVIVRIDLNMVGGTIIDVSAPNLAASILEHPRAVNFSARHQEVLINGAITSDAISIFEQ